MKRFHKKRLQGVEKKLIGAGTVVLPAVDFVPDYGRLELTTGKPMLGDLLYWTMAAATPFSFVVTVHYKLGSARNLKWLVQKMPKDAEMVINH